MSRENFFVLEFLKNQIYEKCAIFRAFQVDYAHTNLHNVLQVSACNLAKIQVAT